MISVSPPVFSLVAVVGHHTLALSVSISPVHRAECHQEMVVSGWHMNGTGSRIQALMSPLRSVAVPTYYGVSVGTRVALGDDDIGRWDTLRRGERP